MAKCEWCGKNTEELKMHTDAIGDVYNICNNCEQVANTFRCRKCNSLVDSTLMIKGLCTTCIQVDMHNKSKRREEIRMGVDRDMVEPLASALELSDEDYEKWLTMDNTYTPDDLKRSKELRYIWIMVKLNSVGEYDNEVIKENFNDIEELLNRNFSKLIGNKCKVIIGNNSDNRKIIRGSEVIDYVNQSYILKA